MDHMRALRTRSDCRATTAIIAAITACVFATAASPHDPQPSRQENDRAAAQKLLGDAEQLRSKRTEESLRQAIDRLEQSIPLWRSAGDRSGEAATLHLIGATCRSLGDNRRALQYLEQALTARRAIGEQTRTIETLSELGAVYHTIGDSQKAVAHYSEALGLARGLGDRRNEALTLNRLGLVYDSWGEYERALAAFSGALDSARAAGDRRMEAAAMGNLGRLHQAAGDTQKALESFREALSRFQELDDRSRQSIALHNIGTVYHSLGETRKAIGFYDDALRLARSLGDRHAALSTLNTLAMAHSALGEHRHALELLSEALSTARDVSDPRLVAYTLHNLGDVYHTMGEEPRALDYELEALRLRHAQGDRAGEARVLVALGSIYAATEQPEKASNAYGEALSLTRDVQDRGGEARALTGLARLERRRGDLAAAQAHMADALALIESLRSRIAIQELRSSYLASAQAEYEFYIDLLMQLHASRRGDGFDALALQASERARARGLLELLAEAGAEIRQGVDPTLLEREQSLQRRLHAKAARQRELLGDAHSSDARATIGREIESLTTDLSEAEGQIRAHNPRYAAVMQPQPLSLREIQQQVLEEGTLLLEYSLGEERSYVWAVTNVEFAAYALPGRAAIEAAARRYYDLLGSRSTVPGQTVTRRARVRDTDREYQLAAEALSDMLLRPVATHLGSNRLLIVSAGALQYVPFGALPLPQHVSDRANESTVAKRDDTARPLIAEHEIVSLPSASVLAAIRKEVMGREPAARALAVIADPVFDADDERVSRKGKPAPPVDEEPAGVAERAARDAGVIGADGRIARLPFTRREAESILALVPPGQGMKAIDFQASRDLVTSDVLRRYRIVHFATHGFLNTEHPELSGIVLSLVDRGGAPQDGFVRVHELYNVSIPAELVVLSACQTALGKEIRGEGLIGVTRGLMYAGAPRVVSSLWKVDDVATSELMRRFYEAMLGSRHMSPATALRAAQLEMRQQRRWSAPYYWAGFVMQGEWRGWKAVAKGSS
jgi:CHAT domain-containing protein/tetratricopeptide (TPR) repeat protein